MADETEGTEDATSEETETTEGNQEGGQPADLGDAGKKALKAERERASAAEKRAKKLEDELEEFKRSQMTDHEKALDEAKAAGRAEAAIEAASEVAAAEFKAAAAGRMEDDQIKTLTDGLDLAAFMTEGKVDVEKIKAFVDTIAPSNVGRRPDLGQGARGGGSTTTDPLLQTVQQFVGR